MTHAEFQPGADCPGPIYLERILQGRIGTRPVHACQLCGWTDEPIKRSKQVTNMAHEFIEIWRALNAPFEPEEVRTRPQGGRQLAYITARTVMNRLDDVLGPGNWWDDYVSLEHSVVCRLTLRLPDGRQITKSDAGGHAGMADQGDDEKSGYSDAFKRAAVKFGVGRYLYRDGVPKFMTIAKETTNPTPAPRPAPPPAPAPKPASPPPQPQRAPRLERSDRAERPALKTYAPPTGEGEREALKFHPTSGRHLYSHIADQREAKEMLSWIKGRFTSFPSKMIDWTPQQAATAWPEIKAQLREIRGLAPVAS